MNCVSLAQLLALCGSVAFWQVSHLERSVSAELRRRRGEMEEREQKEKGSSNKTKVWMDDDGQCWSRVFFTCGDDHVCFHSCTLLATNRGMS